MIQLFQYCLKWVLGVFVGFSLLSASGLQGAEPFLIVDSDRAEYDGKNVVLNGNVVVDHALGQISCGAATLLEGKNSNKGNLAVVQFSENVLLRLADGGTLQCVQANIDFQTHEGAFLGDRLQEVVYDDYLVDGMGVVIPITLKSGQMKLRMVERAGSVAASIHSSENIRSIQEKIADVVAEKEVALDYNKDFVAKADRVTYCRLPEHDCQSRPGFVYLHPQEPGGKCQISDQNGDCIKASQIRIDSVERKLYFDEPRGFVFVTSDKGLREKLDFSSGILVWDKPNDHLLLRQNVVLEEPGMGKISSDKDIEVWQKEMNGKIILQLIKSSGTTHLEYQDKDTGATHCLTCYGKFLVDHIEMLVLMESPDCEGKIEAGKQVAFQDSNGEVRADKAYLQYVVEDQVLRPAKITLVGNVNILSYSAQGLEAERQVLQYAIADSVEYVHGAQEMRLLASNDGRVLLYDKSNKIQVSAPEIEMRRDGITGKESFHGVGDVRFTFVNNEIEQLMKRFDLKEQEL